ncbi:hypothetical protein LFL97_39590 (plasmid) [Burkholderia sp. JSH-S8]|nr:hypothetical protein LFL97_39590 [Burkholderia sp. JSH-S8]
MLNSEPNRAGEASVLVAGNQMVAQLLLATSLDGLEDMDAYVRAIEPIVFELLARHVDSESRGAARAAYKAGIAAGLYGASSEAKGDAEPGMVDDGRSSALLKLIADAGREHGRAILRWSMSRCAHGTLSKPGVSRNIGVRGAANDFP